MSTDTKTASGGTTPASLAASVEATATASARPAEGVASPAAPSAPDCDDRAVRLALGWGAANLRLALVRDALKDCCEADRVRILGALGRDGS